MDLTNINKIKLKYRSDIHYGELFYVLLKFISISDEIGDKLFDSVCIEA